MKLVLLSGGSGKRLWPLSNDSRSKQFLKVLRNRRTHEPESMVQRVWSQLVQLGLADSAYIATCKTQIEIIRSQLGNAVPLIIEPERRDTFPAVALACAYLHSVVRSHPDEVICVLPVDPAVEEKYFAELMQLERIVLDSGADVALMGVKPTYPSEKYGYIVPDAPAEASLPCSYAGVLRFEEKPKEARAAELIRGHALWNCGVFAFRLGFLLATLKRKGLPIRYEDAVGSYAGFPKTSFDYEVLEKGGRFVVHPYEGSWKDLGTWGTLTEEMDARLLGKGTIDGRSANTHVINELDIPVTVIDIPNAIVAASPDGILVADKAASSRVKELMKGDDHRPMYEERRWGWFRVLDYSRHADGSEVLTNKTTILAGKHFSYQLHRKRREVWTIVSGEGRIALGNRLFRVGPGDIWHIPPGTGHSIKAETDLDMIEVQAGELADDDIVRLYTDWGEIERYCDGPDSEE